MVPALKTGTSSGAYSDKPPRELALALTLIRIQDRCRTTASTPSVSLDAQAGHSAAHQAHSHYDVGFEGAGWVGLPIATPAPSRYKGCMLVAAHVATLRQAASSISPAGGPGAATWSGGIGHQEADAALSDFASAMSRHTSNLAEAGRQGSEHLGLVAQNFEVAGA